MTAAAHAETSRKPREFRTALPLFPTVSGEFTAKAHMLTGWASVADLAGPESDQASYGGHWSRRGGAQYLASASMQRVICPVCNLLPLANFVKTNFGRDLIKYDIEALPLFPTGSGEFTAKAHMLTARARVAELADPGSDHSSYEGHRGRWGAHNTWHQQEWRCEEFKPRRATLLQPSSGKLRTPTGSPCRAWRRR